MEVAERSKQRQENFLEKQILSSSALSFELSEFGLMSVEHAVSGDILNL